MARVRTPTAALAALATLALIAAAASAAPPTPGGCPASDAHVAASTRAGAQARLVPTGARSVRLCQYNGLDPANEIDRLTAGRLVRGAATTTALAADLDAIPQTSGIYSCPADTGSSIVAYFRYRSGPRDPVTVDLSGCEIVTNGLAHRIAGVTAAGRAAISALLAALHPTPLLGPGPVEPTPPR
jgi:hypothetical protein